jgi:D-alanyl-D-alanine carboxypeptidase
VHLLFAGLLALSDAVRSAIDATVARVMQAEHVPGLSLGIARAGTTLYLRGYGLRDLRDRLPARGDTPYPVGSIAKQFAAALVLQDAAAGTIALDAPLNRYLPAAAAAGDASVAQVLGQTGGVAAGAGDFRAPGQTLVEAIAGAARATAPGAAWIYSNANYVLLEAALERVDRASWPDLLRARIVEPLGLRSTGYGAPPAGLAARGYEWHAGWSVAPAAGIDDDRTQLAGGMYSTAPDLLRWLDALRAGRVVSPDGFAAMTSSGKLSGGVATNYGFGFFIGNWFGYRVAEHPGYVDGFSAQDALVLDDGLEVAVLANRAAVDLTPLTMSLVAAIDRPRDANLAARPSQPPQDENFAIAADVKALLETPGFASLGALQSIEFVERSLADGTTYDKYRATFSTGQWWVTVGYRENGPIEALTLSPVQ